ncbi:class I SAM-dependent methyltransferase [Streptomyces sp. cg36]|uniref:class I SAM-dependent methyltransferase n=1 Tax=Streptomyces sp. cg36 TaxID=3238798 RepID=UPI0034E2A3A4
MTEDTSRPTPYADAARIFQSTARYYARYRLPHPAVLTDHIVSLAREHTAAPRMADLGCGTGLVSLELAARGVDVIAVDANPAMLAEGRKAAAERGLLIDWREGTGENIAAMPGTDGISGAVIADAFHWMDRPQVLHQLDQVVAPGGFVAVLVSRAANTERPWWWEVIARVRARFVGEVPAAGVGQEYKPPQADHETVLRHSPFSRVAVTRAEHTVRYTTDELVAVQFTYAFSSPDLLGDRCEEFSQAVRAALLAVEPSGRFEATATAALILGWRAHG